jgi:hypothetical protein
MEDRLPGKPCKKPVCDNGALTFENFRKASRTSMLSRSRIMLSRVRMRWKRVGKWGPGVLVRVPPPHHARRATAAVSAQKSSIR